MVTVIVPRIPDGVPLERTLNSICRQTQKSVEIILLFPLSEEFSSHYKNLKLCDDLDDAIENANGKYLYFMHPEGVLSLTALKRMLDNIGAAPCLTCKAVMRYDIGSYIGKNTPDLLVYRSLYLKEYIKTLIKTEALGGANVEFLPKYILSDSNHIFIDDILIYIDVFMRKTTGLSLEITRKKIMEHAVTAKINIASGYENANYSLFTNYVMKHLIFFNNETWKYGKTDELYQVFEAVNEFMSIFSSQPEFVRFINNSLSLMHTDYLHYSKEAYAAMPLLIKTTVKPVDIKAIDVKLQDMMKEIKAMKAIMTTKATPVVQTVRGDAVAEFINGRAGLKTLIRCFGAWLKTKF